MTVRVLCVEDDRINAMLIAHLCEIAGGIELRLAASGADARRQLEAWQPDALLLDLHLPDGDGRTLLPELRALAGRADLHAVLCTAESPVDAQAAARDAGFDACWSKPVHIEDLRTLVDRVSPADDDGAR